MTEIIEIPLSQGKVTIIDKDDYERISNFSYFCKNGYAVRRLPRNRQTQRTIGIHRDITNCPAGMEVDHINGNKLDNRKCNLRICTGRQNKKNRNKSVRNKSGYNGVFLVKKTGKYYAYITLDYKKYSLGFFSNKHDAGRAYNIRAKEFYGEFARLNIIEDEL